MALSALAQVRFERGEIDDAITAQTKVVELTTNERAKQLQTATLEKYKAKKTQ
jgi:hypothetical protein